MFGLLLSGNFWASKPSAQINAVLFLGVKTAKNHSVCIQVPTLENRAATIQINFPGKNPKKNKVCRPISTKKLVIPHYNIARTFLLLKKMRGQRPEKKIETKNE